MKQLLDKWHMQSEQINPIRIRGLTRRRLVEHYGESGLIKGAEIGVDRGRFSEYMFGAIPNLELLCVDPWYWKLRGQSRYESTLKRMEQHNATVVRMPSFEAVMDVPDHSLDFVYIDGAHRFDMVNTDLIWWSMKVRYGGMISGHDYYRFRHAGVVPAVDAYTQQHGIAKWFLTDERTPSFFWIHEHTFADTTKDQN